MLAPRFAQMGSRTTAQLVGPPLDMEIELKVRVDGRAPEAAWSPVELEGPGGAAFTTRATRTDEALVVRRTIHVPLMRVPPERYGAFARFVRQADAAEARELPLR